MFKPVIDVIKVEPVPTYFFDNKLCKLVTAMQDYPFEPVKTVKAAIAIIVLIFKLKIKIKLVAKKCITMNDFRSLKQSL